MRPAPARSSTSRRDGSGSLFLISGHGWGHGVGMGQWGAEGYALHGYTYDEILAAYYPGTVLSRTTVRKLRVLLADGVSAPDRLLRPVDHRRRRDRRDAHASRRQHEAHDGAPVSRAADALAHARRDADARHGVPRQARDQPREREAPRDQRRRAAAVPRRRRPVGDAVDVEARRARGAGGRVPVVRPRGHASPERRTTSRSRASRTPASRPRRRRATRRWTRRRAQVLTYGGKVATTVYSSRAAAGRSRRPTRGAAERRTSSR